MEPNQSEHLYTVRFDERQEAWFVHTDAGRIPLTRTLLQHLVSLYNSIHRGDSLTLIERRALEELGRERQDFADGARSLRDQIDAQTGPAQRGAAGLGHRFTRAAGSALGLLRRRLQAVLGRR
jgi:hypothetical protein